MILDAETYVEASFCIRGLKTRISTSKCLKNRDVRCTIDKILFKVEVNLNG